MGRSTYERSNVPRWQYLSSASHTFRPAIWSSWIEKWCAAAAWLDASLAPSSIGVSLPLLLPPPPAPLPLLPAVAPLLCFVRRASFWSLCRLRTSAFADELASCERRRPPFAPRLVCGGGTTISPSGDHRPSPPLAEPNAPGELPLGLGLGLGEPPTVSASESSPSLFDNAMLMNVLAEVAVVAGGNFVFCSRLSPAPQKDASRVYECRIPSSRNATTRPESVGRRGECGSGRVRRLHGGVAVWWCASALSSIHTDAAYLTLLPVDHLDRCTWKLESVYEKSRVPLRKVSCTVAESGDSRPSSGGGGGGCAGQSSSSSIGKVRANTAPSGGSSTLAPLSFAASAFGSVLPDPEPDPLPPAFTSDPDCTGSDAGAGLGRLASLPPSQP